MSETGSSPTPILPCMALFGIERGAQMAEHIEAVSGQPCPCKQGHVCPLTGERRLDTGHFLRAV